MSIEVHQAPSLLGSAACALLLASAAALAAEPAAPAAAPMQIHRGENVLIPEGSPLRARVSVALVGAQPGGQRLSTPAMVEANPALSVNVLAPLTGRLVDLKVELGQSVRRGQVLALLTSPDLAQAESDVERAADTLDLARKALDRALAVGEAGANAGKDREAAESTVNQAASEDRRARARLQVLAGASAGAPAGAAGRGALAIVAPIDGVVTALNVGRGAYVNDATAPLLAIADLRRVWVTAQVPEPLLGAVARGLAAEVHLDAYPGLVLRGTVRSVSPVLEPDTRRVKVRIEFDNADGRFKPNMFATASFAVKASPTVVVPASALLMNNDSVSVFVETAAWTFTRRYVEIGSEDGEQVRIVRGLKDGERVIVRGGILLND